MRYVGQRFVQLLIVVFAVTFVVSIALRFVPNSEDRVVLAKTGGAATPEQREEILHELYLDRSIPEQYALWVRDFVTLDWGITNASNQEITEVVKNSFPISLRLMIYAQILALGFAIPIGIWSAYRAGGTFDRASTAVAFGLLAAPVFILAPLLIRVFALQLDWFPVRAENVGFFDSPVEHVRNYFLSVLTLAIPLYAVYMRLLRADMVTTLQSDFITTARAKGLSTNRILWVHALRPSMFSLVTAAAIQIGALIGGAVIVEQTFGLNGIGYTTVQGVFTSEYSLVQTTVALLALVYVLANFAVDIAYAWLDPRVRTARAFA